MYFHNDTLLRSCLHKLTLVYRKRGITYQLKYSNHCLTFIAVELYKGCSTVLFFIFIFLFWNGVLVNKWVKVSC